MTALESLLELAAREQYLAIVSTSRADGTIQSSLVNAGPIAHPDTGQQCLAFVTYGRVKLANLAARPQVTLAFRSGWRWAAAEGRAQLRGPDDTDPERLRLLLRQIFTGAGGQHEDWDTYDRVMREQRRVAVLIEPTRIYGN